MEGKEGSSKKYKCTVKLRTGLGRLARKTDLKIYDEVGLKAQLKIN